ncbi:AbrB family transcriptional regulator [Intestinimonas butyriciproducens]|uniref:AbrB family transcriptional regulator n=1 Tax=Intestinimonas butyriciproducens TaxID=1297617 RepID=UPI0008219B95|nr:AbrB family transcriptional regulator [Intestinimonas butyriciproducens]SCJ62482.1 Putative ammonia monooxygenase [uncultured Clostridium sp.]MCI6362666.1 AbrB family transcriptional regulator [Intestinimonas butyriciproducens]MDB7831263.1 AbrB family transcriptional regulator [Intestinimonas butyriciproducens]MDY3615603.1 AbrB family transcriptional regulator [Intestinimonas butyriciproducens]OLR67984.1 hypothetical protein BIV19_10535 [Intestinimonas butyriciproducens]
MTLAATVGIAVLGAYLFYRMKVPAGALIGAILFTAIFNIMTGMGTFPTAMKTVVQAIAGGFIGQRITRGDLKEMKTILGASLLMFFCMAADTVVVGFLMFRFSELDLATALVAAMPAGLSDIALISTDLGADGTLSTALQLVRTLFAIMVLPQIAFRVCARLDGEKNEMDPTRAPGYKAPDIRTWKNALITLILAEAAGIAGKLAGIPAGAMIFAVFAVAARNVKSGHAYLPKKLRLAAQCVAGTIVGVGITMQDVENIRFLLIPALILVVSLVLCNYLFGWLIHKVCGLDLATALFGAIPAGVSDMALISTETGGDAPKVAALQLVRYVGILSLMPVAIQLLTTVLRK